MRQLSLLILYLILLIAYPAFAQEDSIKTPLHISGYLESYYSFDLAQPSNHTRPSFLSSYNRTSEFALNLAYLTASYRNERVKAEFSLMTGTYAQTNLAQELPLFRSLREAWLGAKLSPKQELWLDAGVFSSHIGFESAVGAESWTLTRSILAENSPYYESGIRLHYSTPSKKWKFMLLMLNGWQSMRMANGHQLPSVGHQIVFTPTEKVTLNSSSFIGHVPVLNLSNPAPALRLRYFHNFFSVIQLTPKIGLIAGLDVGMQEVSPDSFGYWYAPIIMFRYMPTPKWRMAVRGEYYSDLMEQVVSNPGPYSTEIYGYSLNTDYELFPGFLMRLEYRAFLYSQPFFTLENPRVFRNQSFTGSMSYSF